MNNVNNVNIEQQFEHDLRQIFESISNQSTNENLQTVTNLTYLIDRLSDKWKPSMILQTIDKYADIRFRQYILRDDPTPTKNKARYLIDKLYPEYNLNDNTQLSSLAERITKVYDNYKLVDIANQQQLSMMEKELAQYSAQLNEASLLNENHTNDEMKNTEQLHSRVRKFHDILQKQYLHTTRCREEVAFYQDILRQCRERLQSSS